MADVRFVRASIVALAFSMLLPAVALAQSGSGIAGVVKDTSGAVLPGVTVEAASPALIERVRTVVSDEKGEYKILDLRPGTYAVTFTLTGFSTVRREGIELAATFTATVNTELRVGALEETVTVSGQSPVVDVQNIVQQTVVNKDLITALPTARNFEAVAQTIPGMTVGRVTQPSGQDVGGLSGERAALLIHGSRQGDFNQYMEGLSFGSLNSNFAASSFTVDPMEVQEFTYNVGAGSAQYPSGGVAVNVIPKTGGNDLTGTFFGNFSRPSLQSDNLAGLPNTSTIDHLVKLWDLNPAFGGPIKRDKLWFFAAGRYFGLTQSVANNYYAKDPTAFVRVPDLSRPALDDQDDHHEGLRLTLQVNPKNTLSVYGMNEGRHQRHYSITSSVSPEAISFKENPVNHFVQTSWNAPLSNAVLIEAGTLLYTFHSNSVPQPEVAPNTLSVLEQSTGLQYRAANSYQHGIQHMYHFRGAASYITGSHAFKVGFTLTKGSRPTDNWTQGDLNLQALNGVPRSVIQWATPYTLEEQLNSMAGLYAQDQWTVKRLTLNLGIRYDHQNESVPAQTEPAGQFVAARSFAEITNVPNWSDIGPRLGLAYDLFGTGKTALKVTLSRYIGNEALDFANANNPVKTSVNSASRTWNDVNGNFYPDCNFLNLAANAECGAISNVNFGKPNVTTKYDDALRSGWGVRPFNWETTVGVQHELLSGVAVNATYFRRWFGNFYVTRNLAVTPANYDPYCITAPTDSRLPGGGNPICGLYDINPSKFGQVNNLVTNASNYGKRSEHYNGFDFTMNARLAHGALASGGVNIGRSETHNCFVVDSPQQLLFCDIKPPFQAQVRLLGSYPLPWWDLLLSGTFQSLPGPSITASYTATNAQIAPSLGRNLAAGANGTATIPLLASGSIFGDHLYQLDGRLSKIIRSGRRRIQGNFDVYNMLNANPILTLNNTFGPLWQQPAYVLPGRLIKFGVQVDF